MTETPPTFPRVPWLRPSHLVAAGVLALFGAGAFAIVSVTRKMTEPEPPTHEIVLRDRAAVITAVRDLARLETVSYHVERVVDLRDRQQRLFGLVQSEDAILLVAAGDVTAGIDFAELRDGDITFEEPSGRVTIVLPPTRIFTTAVDNERTYVHTRRTGILAERNEELETAARREAQRSIEQAARESDALVRARTNAEQTIRMLLRATGHDDVVITWREE